MCLECTADIIFLRVVQVIAVLVDGIGFFIRACCTVPAVCGALFYLAPVVVEAFRGCHLPVGGRSDRGCLLYYAVIVYLDIDPGGRCAVDGIRRIG